VKIIIKRNYCVPKKNISPKNTMALQEVINTTNDNTPTTRHTLVHTGMGTPHSKSRRKHPSTNSVTPSSSALLLNTGLQHQRRQQHTRELGAQKLSARPELWPIFRNSPSISGSRFFPTVHPVSGLSPPRGIRRKNAAKSDKNGPVRLYVGPMVSFGIDCCERLFILLFCPQYYYNSAHTLSNTTKIQSRRRFLNLQKRKYK
jgi:hypothetical protein